MLGRLLRVARPDDWTGTLSRVVIGVAFVLLAVVVVLVRLPEAWVELAGGRALVVRVALMLVEIAVLAVARAVLVARLPRAAVLFGRKVRFHDGTRRLAVPIDEIAALHVEQRPPPVHEVFVIEQRDGAEHDLCPAHWWGAPALHRALDRKVAAAHRRRARARARAAKRGARAPAARASEPT
ncbi:MAG: hypothetical protein H6712_07820 [Myxococcales bacterium]|nr:hypothetical protein [Myxococcales bacterium]MCB9713744.1 hypothetical protein [Myxococcales bacterium]